MNVFKLPRLQTASVHRFYIRIAAGLGYLFLVAPIVAIMPLSFSDGTFLSYPIQGFSLRWYEAVLSVDPWGRALANSLIVGVGSTCIALALGTSAAFGLVQLPENLRGAVMAFLTAPMIIPAVIAAVAIYYVFARVGLAGSFIGLIFAHAALISPLVIITVSAALKKFNFNLMRAAASLGASNFTSFRLIAMPILTPALFTSAVFAFVTSFDEIIVTLFIAAPGQFTLPRQLFAGLRDHLDPSIVAVAALQTVVSFVVILLLEVLGRRSGPPLIPKR